MLSIVVPVYNVEAYLERCVNSLLAQSVEKQILLVDDGSTDGSGGLCDALAQAHPEIQVIHQENGGLSAARNRGLEAAAGSYVTFVDSDDWIEPDAYGPMLRLLEQTGADLVVAGRYDVNAATGEKIRGLCPRQTTCISGKELAGKILLWEDCDSSACDKIYRRELFGTLRYPEGRVCEDVPVTYRLALKARKAALYSQPVYNYFHRPQSISNTAAVTQKSFHFLRHAQQVYEHICAACPELIPQARYLLVRALAHSLLLLELGDPAARREFSAIGRQARRQLGSHMAFVLASGYFSPKERIRNLLLAAGGYRLLRPLFTQDRSRL